jgi:hypothetical protein
MGCTAFRSDWKILMTCARIFPGFLDSTHRIRS